MSSGADAEILRALVREALADLLPGPAPAQASTAPPEAGRVSSAPPEAGRVSSAPAQGGAAYTVRDGVGAVETVSVRTDQELAAFVTRLLQLFENPRRRDDLRSGRLRFRLAAGGTALTGPAGSARPVHRIDKGAVTEAAVRDAARAGARLVLGRRAVLTPLARDRARAAGVDIEKER